MRRTCNSLLACLRDPDQETPARWSQGVSDPAVTGITCALRVPLVPRDYTYDMWISFKPERQVGGQFKQSVPPLLRVRKQPALTFSSWNLEFRNVSGFGSEWVIQLIQKYVQTDEIAFVLFFDGYLPLYSSWKKKKKLVHTASWNNALQQCNITNMSECQGKSFKKQIMKTSIKCYCLGICLAPHRNPIHTLQQTSYYNNYLQ